MAIVKLKKMTLSGLSREKQRVLEKLQQLGGAHLIPLTERSTPTEIATLAHTEQVVHALKYLVSCPKKRHQVSDWEDFDLQAVADHVLRVKAEIRQLADQRDFLIKRIAEIEPWGDFTLPEKEELAGIRLWFYRVPGRYMNKLPDDLIKQVVHQDNIYSYVVVLSTVEPQAQAMPVPRTHTGSVPLSQLRKNLERIELQLEDMHAERESLTRWITLLSLSLFQNEDQADLKVADTLTLDRYTVFVLQAWIPEYDTERFQQFSNQLGLAFLLSDPVPTDRPPTMLENPEALAGGEELIGFYQTPGYFDWDPSVMVFFSFTLFFAMILSDAGYAGVLGLFLALKWNTLGTYKKGVRFRMLAFVTISISLLWGVLTGGYFGFLPQPGTLAANLVVFDLKNFDSMMQLSIAIGAAHIIIANAIKAWQKKHTLKAMSSIGWSLVVMASLVFWWATQTTMGLLRDISYLLFGTGLVLIVLFSGDRVFRHPLDLLWRLLEGIRNLTGITRIFGDILSYMRLFALGLASSSLALTFNQLAMQVLHSVPGPGLFFSILVLLAGHSLNLLLCMMSGVVHGLRLNFIEFYNWSVSDEGYPFKAFARRGRMIND